MREQPLGNAHQCITVNAAVVRQTFIDACRYLSGKTIMDGEDRRTDHRRKPGIDQDRAAHHDEVAKFRRVTARRFRKPVDFAPLYKATW